MPFAIISNQTACTTFSFQVEHMKVQKPHLFKCDFCEYSVSCGNCGVHQLAFTLQVQYWKHETWPLERKNELFKQVRRGCSSSKLSCGHCFRVLWEQTDSFFYFILFYFIFQKANEGSVVNYFIANQQDFFFIFYVWYYFGC